MTNPKDKKKKKTFQKGCRKKLGGAGSNDHNLGLRVYVGIQVQARLVVLLWSKGLEPNGITILFLKEEYN